MFLALWAALCVFLVSTCHAQIGGDLYSERSSSRPHGKFIVGWNTTGSTIADGILVMADTTGATSQPQVALGKGFKPWTHVTTFGHAQRVLGVTVGSTPGYSQGRILIVGFHPWVKVDATAITAFALLKPSTLSTTNGAMGQFAASDTTTSAAATMRKPIIGIFQRYANVDSLRAYVWVNTLGAISP
jgi:hypothetical protein